MYQDIDLIFTMSDYLRRSFIEDFAVPPAKIRTIGAGVNLEQIPGPRNKDYEQKKILFVGADFERKGGLELLRAFKMVRSVFPDAQLFIAGPRDLKIPEGSKGAWCFLGSCQRTTRATPDIGTGTERRNPVRSAIALRTFRDRPARGNGL